MTSSGAFTRSQDRVRRIGDAGGDAHALRLALLDEIRTVVGFDAYAFLLCDPESTVGASPLADVPCLPELPTLIRLKYLTGLNRWTSLGRDPVATLQRATGGELDRSRLWHELLCHYDVGDVASIVFADRFGCWGFLDLWRASSEPAFDDADVAYLLGITDAITVALRRRQADSFSDVAGGDNEAAGPVVLLLSPDLQLLGKTPETDEYLRQLVPAPPGRSPIPASAYNVAAQLLAVEAGVDAHPPWARVHLFDGRWLTLAAARLSDRDDAAAIAVTIEPTPPAQRLGMFSRAFALSPRERELLGHLVTGADTRELARTLHLSEHTVQDHLKSIFAKTGAPNRRVLVSRALGAGAPRAGVV